MSEHTQTSYRPAQRFKTRVNGNLQEIHKVLVRVPKCERQNSLTDADKLSRKKGMYYIKRQIRFYGNDHMNSGKGIFEGISPGLALLSIQKTTKKVRKAEGTMIAV